MIRSVQKTSREHSNYIMMYNEITARSNKKYALLLAKEIEGISSKVYTKFITDAEKDGDIRNDINPRLFAFFFDNMLMMMQFSYSCDYYHEQFKIYCSEEAANDDELVVKELIKFLESAFTFSRSEINHTQ
jgi:TetR/AcrR family transcriptional regulator